jgi:hypothetical protein
VTKYLLADEVARSLGVESADVVALIRTLQLPGVYLAGEPHWRVAERDLEAYIEARK